MSGNRVLHRNTEEEQVNITMMLYCILLTSVTWKGIEVCDDENTIALWPLSAHLLDGTMCNRPSVKL